jgi:hypothetical protein
MRLRLLEKAPEGITSEITQSNFVVSHDWHVQLCCQRSQPYTPKRKALIKDQRTGIATVLCVLELDALFVLGSRGGVRLL